MGIRKKIGTKYCGGCNAIYERVERVEQLKFRMQDRFLFIRHDQQDLDGLILINGCPRSCAGEDLNRIETPYLSVTGEGDFENLVHWLIDLDGK